MLFNTKPKSFKMDSNKNRTLEGNREEILKVLKKLANPNCNKCYGRGHIGYEEDRKTKSRTYIPCHKCVNGK